eukprot:1159330-Pelagomonas_calceolata.AAC.2
MHRCTWSAFQGMHCCIWTYHGACAAVHNLPFKAGTAVHGFPSFQGMHCCAWTYFGACAAVHNLPFKAGTVAHGLLLRACAAA